MNSSSHSENAEFGTSQTTSPVSSTSVTPRKYSIRRHAPYRLDQAVRKLTDRLEAKLEENGKSTTTEEKQNGVSHDESVEKNSPVENGPLINTFNPQQLFANNFFNSSSIGNPNSGVDPLAFLMFKNFANTESQNSDVANSLFQKSKNHADEMSIGGISGDEDEEDKMSNESSPTPSDSSNGKEYKYTKDSEKPFTCGQTNCNKRFANKFLLKKHQFIHTGLRPHICPYCAKRFNRKDNLLRHKKTHLANAALPSDGRRRHHALLSPAPLESLHAFNPLNLLQISQNQNLTEDAEEKKLDII
ncbi:hypothetical protein FO519_000225 [Halicephalobus sp. NKZ332]|nr:hypothetical protein FO519_000225 [Halicephalobus sp. NKZ332]